MNLPQQSSLPFGKATMNLKQAKELPIYLTLKEVAEMLKAYHEGRPLNPAPERAVTNQPPSAPTPSPQKKRTVEEEQPLPGPLHPKPSLA